MRPVKAAHRTYEIDRQIFIGFNFVAANVTLESSCIFFRLRFRGCLCPICGRVFWRVPFYHAVIICVCHRCTAACVGCHHFTDNDYKSSAIDKIYGVHNNTSAEFASYGRRAIEVVISEVRILVGITCRPESERADYHGVGIFGYD